MTYEVFPTKATSPTSSLSHLIRHRLKDRVKVRSAGRIAVQEMEDGSFEMRIGSAQKTDAGLYICKLISESGTKQAECRVEVRGE